MRDLAASVQPPPRRLRDDEPAETPAGATDAPADAPWHRFPRGAAAGSFVHDLLEGLARDGRLGDVAAADVQTALRRRCERAGHAERSADVVDWLQRVCTTPLPALGAPPVALAGLDRPVAEMEFWLPADRLDAAAVDALCRAHLLPGAPRPALPARALRGMLMGYVDLVYRHAGRWGVVDYKSNALAAADAGYTAAAMQAAVLAQRYDVQAALYGVALHRLLRTRLGAGYDAARDLHGAVFFFVRGIAGADAGALHLPLPPALLDAIDAQLAAPAAAAR